MRRERRHWWWCAVFPDLSSEKEPRPLNLLSHPHLQKNNTKRNQVLFGFILLLMRLKRNSDLVHFWNHLAALAVGPARERETIGWVTRGLFNKAAG